MLIVPETLVYPATAHRAVGICVARGLRRAVALLVAAMIVFSSVVSVSEDAIHHPLDIATDLESSGGPQKLPIHPGLPTHHDCMIGGCGHALPSNGGWMPSELRAVKITLAEAPIRVAASATCATPERPPRSRT